MSAEPPSSSGLPGRHRPQLSELNRETTEDDLWNLDEEAPAAPPRTVKPSPIQPIRPDETVPGQKPEGAKIDIAPKEPARAPRPARPDEIGDLEDSGNADPRPPERPRNKESVEVVKPEKAEPVAKTGPAKEPVTEPVTEPAEPAAPRESRQRTAAAPPKSAPLRPRLNRREVIGIASFAVVALIAAAWVLTRFFSQLSFTSADAETPDFPLKGERVEVAAAGTFWRAPIRDGANRDVARREVAMIPVLEITLAPEPSGGGALRVVFRNSEGEPVGDSITRSFGAGRFEASNNPTIAFPATDGFLEDGHFQAYRTGKGRRWTADVLEGPSANAPASSFKKLSSIPILPLRR